VTLLTGAAADRARHVVTAVAAALRDESVYDADPGLRDPYVGRGASGAAVFFAELAAETGSDEDAQTALAFLDRALDGAADARPNALLYSGTVGVGWTLAVLERSLVDADDEPNDVDELVSRALTTEWPSADLIRGVTGTGVYLLERLPRPHVVPLLDAIVARLDAMAERNADGTTWYVPVEAMAPDRAALFPDGYYDVGMAHGQAGTVALLAHLTAAGVADAKPLLESSVSWLLARRLAPDSGPGRYPLLVGKHETEPKGGRLAWCYGDAGVAVALLAAARALASEELLAEARETALDAASRTAGTAVNDAPLCHGSAGLMHIFSRLHQGIPDDRLADAARRWAEVAFAMRRAGEPVAGYGSVHPTDDDPHAYEPSAGFLEGAAGVGLAMLAATSDRDPAWDSILLTRPVRA
jgi:lantibiotic modifying enzyme